MKILAVLLPDQYGALHVVDPELITDEMTVQEAIDDASFDGSTKIAWDPKEAERLCVKVRDLNASGDAHTYWEMDK